MTTIVLPTIEVCKLDELPVGLGRPFRVGDKLIAVGHSMGGVILYDLLSDPDKPLGDLKLDLLVTVGSQVGVFELTFRGKELNNEGFSGILVFGTISLLYFVMSYPLSRWGRWLEKRLAPSRSQKSRGGLRRA